MFANFTDRARKLISNARAEALRLDHEYISTEHLLLAMIEDAESKGAIVLKHLGVDPVDVKKAVETIVQRGCANVLLGNLPFTPRAKKALELAEAESHKLQKDFIGTEHLLLGLITEGDGVAAQVLQERTSYESLLAMIIELDVKAEALTEPKTYFCFCFLDYDLTERKELDSKDEVVKWIESKKHDFPNASLEVIEGRRCNVRSRVTVTYEVD